MEGGGEKKQRSREAEKQRSAGIRNNGIIRDRREGGGKVEGGVDEQGGGGVDCYRIVC